MEIEGKVPGLIQFGYLATTTGGMGFGLLCITMAALVSIDFELLINGYDLVRNVGTRSCA